MARGATGVDNSLRQKLKFKIKFRVLLNCNATHSPPMPQPRGARGLCRRAEAPAPASSHGTRLAARRTPHAASRMLRPKTSSPRLACPLTLHPMPCAAPQPAKLCAVPSVLGLYSSPTCPSKKTLVSKLLTRLPAHQAVRTAGRSRPHPRPARSGREGWRTARVPHAAAAGGRPHAGRAPRWHAWAAGERDRQVRWADRMQVGRPTRGRLEP
eukprot:scaffold115860_cov62-Phaeocystis_antarctica.AAC.6